MYVRRVEDGTAERVSGTGYAALPSWSPDQRTLAFVRAEPGRRRVWNLWMRDVSSGDLKRITSYRSGQTWSAAWFPDSRRICYSYETRLVVRDLESGAEKVYASPRRRRLVRTPAVSPDGTRVIFQVQRDGAWLLDLRTGEMRRLVNDPTAEEFSWAPDGRLLAFHSARGGPSRIWLVTPPS